MTDAEKRKLLDGFLKPETEVIDDDYWTEDRLIEAAKRIIARLGINGELQ